MFFRRWWTVVCAWMTVHPLKLPEFEGASTLTGWCDRHTPRKTKYWTYAASLLLLFRRLFFSLRCPIRPSLASSSSASSSPSSERTLGCYCMSTRTHTCTHVMSERELRLGQTPPPWQPFVGTLVQFHQYFASLPGIFRPRIPSAQETRSRLHRRDVFKLLPYFQSIDAAAAAAAAAAVVMRVTWMCRNLAPLVANYSMRAQKDVRRAALRMTTFALPQRVQVPHQLRRKCCGLARRRTS